jgi:hypothetical protein
MGQQVNIKCKHIAKVNQLLINDKYFILDPKTSDLTIIRVIKARTGYRCNDIRWIVVSKWKTNLTSIAGEGRCKLLSRPVSKSEPFAINHQIDGNPLKQSKPNNYSNMNCGTGNDSWYGKI